jgi:hypothetical protein
MLIYGITLIILSLIAVPSLILAKKPNAQELLDKVAPYQGWIGVVFCFWGIWGLIQLLLSLGWLSLGVPFIIGWVTWLLYAIVETTLGFILGYSLIVKYVLSKNEAAKEKGAQVLAKLTPLQGKLGILGLIVGAWCIICAIIVL